MLKKCFVACAVLMIALPTFAGSLKVHEWQTECHYVSIDICTIDVLIDVGYYICIENQDAITLIQGENGSNYSNTYVSNVIANFNALLTVTITPCQGEITVDELYADIICGDYVTAGVTNLLKVYIQAIGVNGLVPAGTKAYKIGEMTISVTPAGCCCPC